MKTAFTVLAFTAAMLASLSAHAQQTNADTAVDTTAGANNNLNIGGNGPQSSKAIGFGSMATAPALPQATPCVTSGSDGHGILWGLYSDSGSEQKIREFCEFKDRWDLLIRTCKFKSAAILQRDFMKAYNKDVVVELHEADVDLSLKDCLKPQPPLGFEPPSAGPVVPVRTEPVKPPVVVPPTPKKVTLKGDALFDFDKADLKAGALGMLDRMAQDLKAAGTDLIMVTVVGHTDSKGSDGYNAKLSQKRAESVKAYLIGRGVDPLKLIAAGKGEAEPIDTNATDDGRARNRRVEVVILGLNPM